MGRQEPPATLRRRSFALLAGVAPALTRAQAFEVEACIDADEFGDALEWTVVHLREVGARVDLETLLRIDELAGALDLTASIAAARARIAATR